MSTLRFKKMAPYNLKPAAGKGADFRLK